MNPSKTQAGINPTELPDCTPSRQRRSFAGHARWGLATAPLLFLFGCAFGVPVVPSGPPVAISFGAPSEAEEEVKVLRGAGMAEQRCQLPCTLQVPSGTSAAVWSGRPDRPLLAVIPPEPSHAEPKYQRRGQKIAGMVLAGIGTVGASVALGISSNTKSLDTQLNSAIAGTAFAGAGLVGLIVALTSGSDEILFTPMNTASR